MTCQALFNTYCFLFAFLPATLAAYWLVPNVRWKLFVLVVGGFTFYSFWDVRFVGLLVVTALVDYLLALRMVASARPRRWLVGSIAFNLGVLGLFKYAMFAAENARSIFQILNIPIEVPYFAIVLPIGISFFTFKTMSYTIDVYWREIPPTRDFLQYLAFIALFPELVAGPIVRYRSLAQQLAALPSRLGADKLVVGLMFLSIGLFKKVVIADEVARVIDPLWGAPGALTTSTAWIAVLGYTLQLYFDFSGYSDMAIGLAALLGLTFPVNFRAPYQARNPSDFWRRWHITLSTWLRDYVYIPLGGNRKRSLRIAVNLLIVMFLGGLWHGAAWTFVLWGVYHGGLLVAYKHAAPVWDRAPRVLQVGATFFLVVMGWVLFRAPDLSVAFHFYGLMFSPAGLQGSLGVLTSEIGVSILAAGATLLAFVFLARPSSDLTVAPKRRYAASAAVLFAISLVFLTNAESPFLYYQF